MVVAYRFTLARIVRAGPVTAHAALDEWAHGQITRSRAHAPLSHRSAD
ncbi:hypothetical protein [Actinacidiphila glaucinigra]